MKKKEKARFAEYQEIHERYTSKQFEGNLMVPSNFRQLCALLDKKPEVILKAFMDAVSLMPGNITEEQSDAAVEYFMSCGYGGKLYSEEDLRQVFKELKARKVIYPHLHDDIMDREQRELFYHWSHMYMQYWFRKWFYHARPGGSHKDLEGY